MQKVISLMQMEIVTTYLTKLLFAQYQRRMTSFEKEIFSPAFNDDVMQMETMIIFQKVKYPFKNIASTFEKRTLYQACNVEFNDDVVYETITTVKNNTVNMNKLFPPLTVMLINMSMYAQYLNSALHLSMLSCLHQSVRI